MNIKKYSFKMDIKLFQSNDIPELNILVNVFKKHNYEIRLVGGAVRDVLSGKYEINDFDFATTATPEEMIEMFKKEEIRILDKGKNLIKHGTIVCKIRKLNFEVTTIKKDGNDNGDWKKDAERRDLTINAMYLDENDVLYDYLNGKEDLLNGVTKFVGDPNERIKEDCLRIIRYFRFFQNNEYINDIFIAIKNNAPVLVNIAGERIWKEFKQIKFNFNTIKLMYELDVLKHIGFPNNINFEEVAKICGKPDLLPITYVTSLLNDEKDIINLSKRLKLSKVEYEISYYILLYKGKQFPLTELVKKNKYKVWSEVLNYRN